MTHRATRPKHMHRRDGVRSQIGRFCVGSCGRPAHHFVPCQVMSGHTRFAGYLEFPLAPPAALRRTWTLSWLTDFVPNSRR